MPIRFLCSACSTKLSVGSRKAGAEVSCPKCRQRIRVPETDQSQHLLDSAANDSPDPLEQFMVFDPDEDELVYERSPREDSPSLPVSDRVAVPRSVLYAQGVLLGVVALVFFILGIVVGSNSSRPQANAFQSEPCLLTGQIAFEDSANRQRPDAGSVVILLPREQRPDEKAPVDGLRPLDPAPALNNVSLATIQALGGAYARADADGRYRLQVPAGGRYFLLCVSRHAQRDAEEQPQGRDLAELGRYFLPATELLGQQKYQWTAMTLRSDREVDVSF